MYQPTSIRGSGNSSICIGLLNISNKQRSFIVQFYFFAVQYKMIKFAKQYIFAVKQGF